ncbi:MAG: Coenzyme F420 hydrogenase/dehydrogenase, beta subunit C-terminal domain [Clostridiales bacterium]|nr:Coenzyme F420 hydrogenase/dehydrogenase, beta subunit C-terminal domain [Clostridiales bacterium]
MKTISYVVKNNLCTGCGTCAGVCPTDAIYMKNNAKFGLYSPEINEDECTHCGLCFRCCPGVAVDMKKLNSFVFNEQPKNNLLGNFLYSYVGHSNDNFIRLNSSSGGLITQLLLFALENGVIDGALVVRMKKDSPLEPEPFIARTKEEILSASQSKYCPVPLNVALCEIIKQKGKIAVVGLPCHIHGIRLAELAINGLKEKIVFHIGLLCSHTVSFSGTVFLLRKFGIDPVDVKSIKYRDKGWPGSMLIELKNGKKLRKEFVRSWNAYWNVFSCFFFTPHRCILCPDQSNEFSDISLGDAWLPEFKQPNLGESVIITRSKESEILLDKLNSVGSLSFKSISPNKVLESQNFSIDFKKKKISGRFYLSRLFGMKVPYVNPFFFRKRSTLFNAFLTYFSVWSSSNKFLLYFMQYIPLSLFRIYFGLFKISSLRTIEGEY